MFALASADASDKIFAASCAVIRVSNVAAAMGEIAFKIFSLSSAVPAYNAADALSSSIATNAAAKARSSCMAANTLAASSGSIISKHAPAKFGFIPQSISAAASNEGWLRNACNAASACCAVILGSLLFALPKMTWCSVELISSSSSLSSVQSK